MQPAHPRALLTLLEGLALWSGAPVRAAISAAATNPQRYGADLFGGDVWPAESALVTFDTALPLARRRRRISGIGDFRALHRVVGGGR